MMGRQAGLIVPGSQRACCILVQACFGLILAGEGVPSMLGPGSDLLGPHWSALKHAEMTSTLAIIMLCLRRVCSYLEARNSGWPLQEPLPATPECCCWTKPQRRWTRAQRGLSRLPWMGSCRTGQPSSWPTACPPSSTPPALQVHHGYKRASWRFCCILCRVGRHH